MAKWHKKIPRGQLVTFLENLQSTLAELTGNGTDSIGMGCACTGTGVWYRLFDDLLLFWQAHGTQRNRSKQKKTKQNKARRHI